MTHPGYNYNSDGQDPTSCCDSGEYDYFYDALGNVNGVLDSGGHYFRWEMDAFGNDLPGGNAFLPMDQPGPKEHLTGKLFDTTTGLYYFAARWYDPQVGRFVSRDPIENLCDYDYVFCLNLPTLLYDSAGLKFSSSFQFDECCKEWFVDKRISMKSIQNNLDVWIGEFASRHAAKFMKEVACMKNKKVAVTCEDCGEEEICGYMRSLSSKVHICSDKISTAKGVADTAIHEKAHICGWGNILNRHPKKAPWLDVPVADITKTSPCDEQIPLRDHPRY